MVARAHWQVESLPQVTSTSDEVNWTDGATLTIPAAEQEAGKKYLVLWSCIANFSSSAVLANVALRVDGVASPASVACARATGSDVLALGGVAVVTAAGAPADIVLKVSTKSAPGNSTSPAIKECRITAFELTANEFSATTAATSAEAAGVAKTHSGLSFTPAATGDYIFLASFLVQAEPACKGEAWLERGASSSPVRSFAPHNSSELWPNVIAWRQNGLTGAQTVNLRFRMAVGSSQVTLREARIVALRVSDFDAVGYAELAAEASTNSTAFVNGLTVSPTMVAREHVVLAAFGVANSDATFQSTVARLTEDGAALSQPYVKSQATRPSNEIGAFIQRAKTYTAGAHTFALDYRTDGASQTAYLGAGAALIVLDLGPPAPIYAPRTFTSSGVTGGGFGGGAVNPRAFTATGVATGAAAGARVDRRTFAATGASTAAAGPAAVHSRSAAFTGATVVSPLPAAVTARAFAVSGLGVFNAQGGRIAAGLFVAAGSSVAAFEAFVFIFKPPPPWRTYRVPPESRLLVVRPETWAWRPTP